MYIIIEKEQPPLFTCWLHYDKYSSAEFSTGFLVVDWDGNSIGPHKLNGSRFFVCRLALTIMTSIMAFPTSDANGAKVYISGAKQLKSTWITNCICFLLGCNGRCSFVEWDDILFFCAGFLGLARLAGSSHTAQWTRTWNVWSHME
jgi:hypothetical protein